MRTQLLNDIRQEISSLVKASNVYSSRTAIEKIYEVYILSCVVKSLQAIGCTLQARDSSDNTTVDFEFRLSPGYIYSPTSRSSFIHVNYNGKEYELHPW